MGTESTPVNPLELSDEDFLKLNAPPPAAGAAGEGEGNGGSEEVAGDGQDPGTGSTSQEGDDTTGEDDPNKAAADTGADEGDDKAGKQGQEGKDGEGKDAGEAGGKSGEDGKLTQDKSKEQDPTGKVKNGTEGKDPKDGQDPNAQGKSEGSQKDGKDPSGSQAQGADDKTKAGQQQGTPDYKGFYEKVMAPLRANGKTIDLKTPEEAIQLMQMGANYTRKMQAIAPHRKVLLMLENNGLLDEGKLSFLIDIDKKNPEAIKKLIKDSGIDPQQIDLEDPNAKPYLEGNHRVTDEEATFRSHLDELSSTPEGKVTLQAIQTQWDQASKEVLWKQPEVMSLIHEQRESGIYDRITAELNRQRTLGTLPANVPFLHAYKAIGDQMASAGGFDDLVKATGSQKQQAPVQGQQQQPQQQTPVATRVQQPKPAAANGDKVNAATSTRSAPKKTETVVNPLALSDEEFMKNFDQFQGRL